MCPVSLPYALTDGTDAYGSEVKADLDAIATKFDAGIVNADISNNAEIAGTKLSSSIPIPGGGPAGQSRIAQNAITVYELRQDATESLNRAVTKNHIQDGAVVANRIDMASAAFAFTFAAQGGGHYIEGLTLSIQNTGTNYKFRVVALHVTASAPVQYVQPMYYPGPTGADWTDSNYAVANYSLVGAYISGLNDDFGTTNKGAAGSVNLIFIKKA